MDLARVQVELDEVDAFISAVEQRKAALWFLFVSMMKKQVKACFFYGA
jgi:hypothetical protein